jgi:uncharacterized membrane protein YeaQ/YmgE (transglycosylase-associated protein family)
MAHAKAKRELLILIERVGSIVGSWYFWVLGVSPDAGLFALVVVAFVGAVVPIGAQRMLWARA